MRIKTVRLDDTTREVLMRSRIEGNRLTLPQQLPRDEYDRVAKAITAAGGKWNRGAQCHIFPHDVRETLNITGDTVAVVNVQQTRQSFYTPAAIANQVAELADLTPGDRVLEPSAGGGALVKACLEHGIFRRDITAVEIDPRTAEALKPLCGKVICADFLQAGGGDTTYDRIVMNPPFSKGDDIKHINHAREFLAPGGRLVAICGAGPRQREAFEFTADNWIDLPAGAFSESGTNVATAIITFNN